MLFSLSIMNHGLEALLFPQVELLRATDCVRHTELVQEDCRGARPVGHTEPASMSDALLDMCGVAICRAYNRQGF